jgi:hypothetical protein
MVTLLATPLTGPMAALLAETIAVLLPLLSKGDYDVKLDGQLPSKEFGWLLLE